MKFYYWIIVAVCCLFSALFSCADMVYSIVDKNRLEREKNNKKLAALALKISNDYELSISAILFGNNVVNILASSIVTIIGMLLSPENISLGTTIATICLTIFIIIFCEFVPKIFAKRYSYKLSFIFAYPVLITKYIFFVFTWPISKLFKLFGKLFEKQKKEEDKIDEEVLNEMVDTMEDEKVLEEDEAEMVRNTIDFSDIEVFEIMTPRVDVYAINIEDDLREIVKDEELFIHSRVPVYKETIDNIVGILPVKKLSKQIFSGNEEVDINDLLYKPIMVPRNKQVMDLLAEFKKSKIHIAIVIDEYGGTEGIVTMEDILEQIVGDIFDETDKVDEEFIDNGDGTYIVDGGMNIEDCFDRIGYDGEIDTDYVTIGGFCQELLDRFAKTGDEVDFDHFHLIILDATDFTVEKLKIIDLVYGKGEE